MGRDAVELQLGLLEGLLDFLGGLEAALVVLDHEIRGLRAGGAGLFRVGQEFSETFGTVLGAFDAGMITGLCHRC